MEVRLHKNAVTTLKIREEIKNSELDSINAIAIIFPGIQRKSGEKEQM